MSRSLVTKRIVKDVIEHSNADALEIAMIDGWNVITKKGEFSKGDSCIFFEIDSWLPADDERFDFLIKTGVKKDPSGRERIRLRTVKLRGELSQGLVLPIHLFPELDRTEEGEDLSDYLEVIKFERPEPKTTDALGNFPESIPKTDAERIQNLWDTSFAHKHKNTKFVPTLKLDGSSCTVYHKDGHVGVCSRNLELKEDPGSHFWKAVEGPVLGFVEDMKELGMNVAVQGEVIGPGIQGNKEKTTSFQFHVFNIFDIDDQRYHEWDDVVDMCDTYHLLCVPVVGSECFPFSDFESLDEILAYADGPSMNASHREGIVWKSVGVGGLVQFKTISNKWLLKKGD